MGTVSVGDVDNPKTRGDFQTLRDRDTFLALGTVAKWNLVRRVLLFLVKEVRGR